MLTEAVPFIMWGALVPDQGAKRSVSLTPWRPGLCPRKQKQPSQPGERFQSWYLLPGLRQPPKNKTNKTKQTSSIPSKLSFICLRLLLGQMTNATVFRHFSTRVLCWVRMLSAQVHTNLSLEPPAVKSSLFKQHESSVLGKEPRSPGRSTRVREDHGSTAGNDSLSPFGCPQRPTGAVLTRGCTRPLKLTTSVSAK